MEPHVRYYHQGAADFFHYCLVGVNLRVECYDPHGNGSPAGAIGQLRQQNLFPDLQAYTVLLGYTYSL